uniref:Uncharacterized protein n=1 Tax=Pithovirus LCPAC304 TaxID=2506594 RepID=A0A481Z746_9VIRU|nr:MAG: hypothetical protein LCPAC304_00390 [Pithovirus LCPAC304]
MLKMEPEPPLLAMRHNQELLRIILENMNYDEIIAFCNTHSQFKVLCDDPESIVGQTLRSKERSAIAAVRVWRKYADELHFSAELMCSDLVEGDFGAVLNADEAATLMGPGPVLVHTADEGTTIITTLENRIRITSFGEDVGLTMHHDLLRKILELAIDMHNKGLENKGFTEIYRNGDTQYIENPPIVTL